MQYQNLKNLWKFGGSRPRFSRIYFIAFAALSARRGIAFAA